MYGPPIDPRQRIAPVEIFDVWEAYAFCAVIGLFFSALSLWRRPPIELRSALFIGGQCILLTAPLAYFLDTYFYGSFPTIDKTGSLAFYLEGVHQRIMAHPIDAIQDPAAGLIGIQVGHLWVTEVFDLVLSPMGAFNLQGLLYPALGWWCAWLLFHEITGNPRVSVLMGFPFGMGLHVFRDLNWYTIEKAAIFWLPLFLFACHRAWRRGGRWTWLPAVVLVCSAWMNIYFGMLNAAMLLLSAGILFVSREHNRGRLLKAAGLAFLGLAPLGVWQWLIMHGGPELASPDVSLWKRATLDTFSLFPLRWDRLEAHRALNLVAVAVAVWGIRRGRWLGIVRFATLAALLFFVISLGPLLSPDGPENPLYMAARATVPGFWRMAKPEVFFHITWLMLLGIAAIEAHRSSWSNRVTSWLYALFVLGWVVMIRTHPAYPPMTMPLPVKMDSDWEDSVFQP
jgi:hypothetical protein